MYVNIFNLNPWSWPFGRNELQENFIFLISFTHFSSLCTLENNIFFSQRYYDSYYLLVHIFYTYENGKSKHIKNAIIFHCFE